MQQDDDEEESEMPQMQGCLTRFSVKRSLIFVFLKNKTKLHDVSSGHNFYS